MAGIIRSTRSTWRCRRPCGTSGSSLTATIVLQGAVGGLLMGLIYALVADRLSLIFGLMDLVNFAHGELLMLAMYATFIVWFATGVDPLLLLVPVAAVLFALGVA